MFTSKESVLKISKGNLYQWFFPDAIRGREQYMIERFGGAKVGGGTSGNTINGISSKNPKADYYESERIREFK